MKLKLFAASLLIVLSFAGIKSTVVHADAFDSVCKGVGVTSDDGESCDEGSGGVTVDNLIRTIISILSFLIGIIAIIMIILGAIKYTTSGGDSSKVTSAKNTIMYALIGLVVAVLAQVLVRYVFLKTTATPPVSAPTSRPN